MSGDVSGADKVGGVIGTIAGETDLTLSSLIRAGSVEGSSTSAGGFIGDRSGDLGTLIEDSTSSSNVTGDSQVERTSARNADHQRQRSHGQLVIPDDHAIGTRRDRAVVADANVAVPRSRSAQPEVHLEVLGGTRISHALDIDCVLITVERLTLAFIEAVRIAVTVG